MAIKRLMLLERRGIPDLDLDIPVSSARHDHTVAGSQSFAVWAPNGGINWILVPFECLEGSPVERLNKSPATDSMIDMGQVFNCTSSINGGPHWVSNFRSEHPGGAFFLFAVLWYVLRGRRLSGLKFRRQFPVEPFIVDFACVGKKLVEADVVWAFPTCFSLVLVPLWEVVIS